MFESTLINSVLAVILTVLVCFVISTLLPGIERKYIHARMIMKLTFEMFEKYFVEKDYIKLTSDDNGFPKTPNPERVVEDFVVF